MSKKNTGGAAFPSEEPSFANRDDVVGYSEGMTLRDYFAAHAPSVPDSFHRGKVMRAMRSMSGLTHTREDMETVEETMVRWRWAYADMMLKAREE